MNLFVYELKSHWKNVLVWGVVIAVFMVISMVKFQVLASDAAASQALLKALPPTMQAVFGMTGLNVATIDGYYGVCFIFLAVMLAIQAGMTGADIIAKEETLDTAEFLYVKPISRARILTAKLLAGLIIIAAVGIATYVATVLAIAAYNHGVVPQHTVVLFTGALACIQLLFYALGIFASAAIGLPKKAVSITAAVVFACYIAYVLWGMSSQFSWMHYISPFAFFAAKDMLAAGSLNQGWVWLCILVSISVVAVSYARYLRRDFKV